MRTATGDLRKALPVRRLGAGSFARMPFLGATAYASPIFKRYGPEPIARERPIVTIGHLMPLPFASWRLGDFAFRSGRGSQRQGAAPPIGDPPRISEESLPSLSRSAGDWPTDSHRSTQIKGGHGSLITHWGGSWGGPGRAIYLRDGNRSFGFSKGPAEVTFPCSPRARECGFVQHQCTRPGGAGVPVQTEPTAPPGRIHC